MMEPYSPLPNFLAILLSIVFTVVGCHAQAQGCTASDCSLASGELLKDVPYEAARFPVGEYSEEDLKNVSYAGMGEAATALWLPTPEDLATLEEIVQTELAAKATPNEYDPYQEALEHYNDYKRQYIGAVINGENVIIANFDRCSEFVVGQLEGYFIPVLPTDGGSCFLELVFDVQSKTFTRFYIHGES